MAYAALASLARAIDQILPRDSDYDFLCGKEQMMSLHEQVVLLRELLDYISKQSFSLRSDDLPESQIRDVAYQLEDIIESVICRSLGQEFESGIQCIPTYFVAIIFCSFVDKLGVLLKESTKMKKTLENKDTTEALASLAKDIKKILPQDEDYAFLCVKEQMKTLHENVDLLQKSLKGISGLSRSSRINVPESRIRDIINQLDDITETIRCRSVGQEFSGVVDKQEFCRCFEEVDALLKEAEKMKKILEIKENIPRALASLARAIDQILSQDEDYAFLCRQEQMRSLHEMVDLLQKSFKNISGKFHSSTIDVLKSRITDVIYTLDDIMESIRCKSLSQEFEIYFDNQDFCRCFDEVDVLLAEAMEMEKNIENRNISRDAATRSSSTEAPTVNEANVGIDADLTRILDQIPGVKSSLQAIPITGMGGIGKTTFARAAYEHSTTVKHFDYCVWVTVSREYCIDDIFRGILPAKKQTEVPNKELLDSVYKILIGRRWLIVLDDVWHQKVWDEVRRAFPKDNNGSCVILTTRLLDVAKYVATSSYVHEMQLLNEEHSWALLRKELYGQEPFIDFENIGRTISNNCKGLPLAIVVVAGMLKFNKTKEYWNEIARNTKEKAASDSEHFFEILSLSYINLPSHLKACFLYMGAFKEAYEIPTKEIARIWTAEGFLRKPTEYKSVEEIAEECLEELVERSLVMVTERGYNEKIKTSSVHDVLREMGLKISQEENFLYYVTAENMNEDSFRNIMNVQRRVSLSTHEPIKLPHDTSVRSILNKNPMNRRQLSIVHHFQLLRVMSKVLIEKSSDLSILFRLANLRYLHFIRKQNFPPLEVPGSISNLQNLETLIFSGRLHAGEARYELVLPEEIWKMPRLRHIVLMHKSKLLFPPPSKGYPVLESLQTLSWVTNFDFSKNAIEKCPNIKKLGVAYRLVSKDDTQQFHLDNLIHLEKLEELAVWCDYAGPQRTKFVFPTNLKKLSLERTRIPWDNMSIVGTLPHLEKLKLKWLSVTGNEWEPNEGEFLSLKYLKMENLRIQDWEAADFPKLETLIIVSCGQLKGIPSEIGQSETLKKLIVKDCRYLMESVDEIRNDLDDYGRDPDLANVSDDEDFLPDLFP